MLSVEYVLKFRLATRTQGSVFKLCFIERLPHPMATGQFIFRMIATKTSLCDIHIYYRLFFYFKICFIITFIINTENEKQILIKNSFKTVLSLHYKEPKSLLRLIINSYFIITEVIYVC